MKDMSICRKAIKDKFICEIAGLVYEIEYVYPYTREKFKDYIIDFVEDVSKIISIKYTKEEFDAIVEMTQEASEAYKEYACIFDKIATTLPDYDMFLMHGALIEYEGQGYIFTAPAGTGKTTHISLWKKYLKDEVKIVNGDKPVLRIEEKAVTAYGTPWCGKEGWQINKSVPLKGICLLCRGKENRIEEISPGKNIEYFIKQLYFDFQSEYTVKVFDLFDKLTKNVRFYLLECDISENAAKVSFEKMTGEEWRINCED